MRTPIGNPTWFTMTTIGWNSTPTGGQFEHCLLIPIDNLVSVFCHKVVDMEPKNVMRPQQIEHIGLSFAISTLFIISYLYLGATQCGAH